MSAAVSERSGWTSETDRALRAFGWDPDTTTIRGLSVSENAAYVVHDEGGIPHLLRLHRPEFRHFPAIESEVQWIRALSASATIDTPNVVPNARGELVTTFTNTRGLRQHAVLFEFRTGTAPSFPEFAARIDSHARLTAALHQHARTWQRPAHFQRPAWTVDAIIGRASAWGSWRAARLLNEPEEALIAEAESLLITRIDRYTAKGGRRGLVHGDLHPGNLLIDGDRVSVIDFDDCGEGWWLWDLACALSPHEADPLIPDLVRRWLLAYQAAAPLDAADIEVVPSLVMLRRIQSLAWMRARADTDGGSALGVEHVEDTVDMATAYIQDTLLPPSVIAPPGVISTPALRG